MVKEVIIGVMMPDMKGIGKKAISMGREFIIIVMVKDTKDIGKMTK